MTAQGIGFGYAKIILLGEHAVVHGQPALAAALNLGMRAKAKLDGRGPRILVPKWNLEVRPSVAGEILARALDPLFRKAHVRAREATVEIEPEVPSKAGLGSSASLSVAIVRALADVAQYRLEPEIVEEQAGLAEEVFHGRASGIDAAVASRGGVLRFLRGAPPIAVVCDGLTLVVAQVEPRAPTREMVQKVTDAVEADPHYVRPLLEKIGVSVDKARSALESHNMNVLAGLMNENQSLLRRLGISTPLLDQACAVAIQAGALAAKLTGAGGGGCIIALAPGKEQQVASALASRATWVEVARILPTTSRMSNGI